MAVVYSIRDWERHFEVAQSRKVEGPLSWVALPCKHDGKGFRRIMLREDGAEIYGAWVLIVQVAAKCPKRGVLADADGPLTVSDLAIKTGCRPEAFDKALKVLTSREIGWMSARELVADWERAGSQLPLQTGQDKQDQPTNQPDKLPAASQSPPNGEPPQGRQAGGLAGSFDLTWEAVAQRLISAGVVNWRTAIDEAKVCGCFPKAAHDLLDFAARYDFGPGAIAKRFAIASPTLGINSGWPNTDRPDTANEKRVKAEAAKRAQRAAEVAEQEAWRRIHAGRAAGKTDDEIRAECESAGLPWPNPAKVEKPKARSR